MGKRSLKVSPFRVITQSKAQLDIANSQYIALTAREIRLIAERDSSDSLVFPDNFSSMGETAKEETIAQTQVFDARRATVVVG